MTRASPATPLRWWASPQAQSVAWQALGSAATLAAALWVSWRLGLAAQGEFGLAKSWFDAGAVIASLGLPQGLLHLQYRLNVPTAALWPVVRRMVLVLALVGGLAAALAWQLGHPLAAAVLASLPLAGGHLMARSLLLAQGVVAYGVVTALPALLVLGGVLALGLAGLAQGFAPLLLLASALAGGASLALAAQRRRGDAAAAWPRAPLWRTSAQSGLQAALSGLLGAALLSVVAASATGGQAVGAASLGLHVYQLFAVAAGYLAPLLFDHLARQGRPSLALMPVPRALRWAAAGAGLLSVVALLLAATGVASAWLLPLGLMLPAGLAAVVARAFATVLQARGDYAELSGQALGRLLLAPGAAWLALPHLPAASAVALALLLTEAATAWRAAHCAR